MAINSSANFSYERKTWFNNPCGWTCVIFLYTLKNLYDKLALFNVVLDLEDQVVYALINWALEMIKRGFLCYPFQRNLFLLRRLIIYLSTTNLNLSLFLNFHSKPPQTKKHRYISLLQNKKSIPIAKQLINLMNLIKK